MGGLLGLLDDVAALARLAAASVDDVAAAAGRATTKAAGVLIDDAAVTPQYVQGLAAERELPIIRRIATGSIRNKLLFVVPVLLLLSEFVPFVLTPLLMLGGGYLCYEGVHKVWGALGHGDGHGGHAVTDDEPVTEDVLVAGAIRTDLILSAEIMVIALGEVSDEGFVARAVILVVVSLIITAIVYGAVALIVKMDDVGLRLAMEDDPRADLGRGLVRAMPKVLKLLSVVGTAAMLWVGGHIWLVGLDELGLSAPYDWLHDIEVAVGEATGALGGFLAWSTDTFFSAILGLLVGAIVLATVLQVQQLRSGAETPAHH